MHVLFLTLSDFVSLQEHHIYADLLREFTKNGHRVYVVSPSERRTGQKTHIIEENNAQILKLRIGNIQKTNSLEKGISTLSIEPQFLAGIKKYFSDVRFDLVIYSTPPITFCHAVEYVKRRDGAKTYLLLKDIFPQNAVDMGMFCKTGVKGLLYRFFRNKEKQLYRISDRIGCMSPANVRYLLTHNPEIDPGKVEVCPNCVDPVDLRTDIAAKRQIRAAYGIPQDKIVFVYGGNLGKPQGIDFIIDCLRDQKANDKAFFLIIGDGTEYGRIKAFVEEEHPAHVQLMQRIPHDEYIRLVAASDVGLVFLDHRFTIPNFPSRLLNYLQAKLPVLVCSDVHSDMGAIVEENGIGFWCESRTPADFARVLDQMENADRTGMGEKGYRFLLDHYTAEKNYHIILDGIMSKQVGESCGL